MTPEETVKELYDKFYGHTPVRKTQSKIEIDKGSVKLDTILAIETVIDAIKHEDNRMYYEIEYWKKCLVIANALEPIVTKKPLKQKTNEKTNQYANNEENA